MGRVKIIIAALILGAFSMPVFSESMFTGKFGVNFFTYKTVYLTTGAAYQHSIREAMNLVYGADFGIHTKENDEGDVEASFLVPLKLGLNFPFGGDTVSYSVGTGISPSFTFGESSDPGFLMGPYLNGSMRIKVHPVMSIFLQVQQDLLFGAPEWIYTGTRMQLGISF
ncbi:MAG: hypothetical protein R6V67_08675 [Spirochaetia bacterium]